MASISFYERVGQAIKAVRDGIQPVLERIWQAHYGDDWIDQVNRLDNHPERDPSPDDLAFLLKGVWNTWRPLFGQQFGHAERNYVSELREARNRWAHNERFSYDDTYRVLDTAERLLAAFAAPDQVEAVRRSKQDLVLQKLDRDARDETRRVSTAATKGEPQAGLAPWREIVTPHPDVAQGRFQQAEFAADLHQVAFSKSVAAEYGDPESFFARTFITDGLGDLLRTAARRLSGKGGDPIVELQTSFGGGKTHSLIALYHLASGTATSKLAGVDDTLAVDDLTVPTAVRRAVFVGQMQSPASPHPKPGGIQVNTLWGELAWQIGGPDAYQIVADDDRHGTNPGSKLIDLFNKYGPVLILIDEWVAYARLLPTRRNEVRLPGGDFDTQFTFAQALTEAAAAVDNTLVLVSIPSSDIEVGGEKGQLALDKLKNVVSRKAAHWRPASTDESFEIVRRRLFEPVPPEAAAKREAVVRAFSKLYQDHPSDFPSESKEGEYRRRMEAAYPIHPELFDRLYEDWSTLDRFQRTRGMLRLMATVISELWKRDDRSLMIMPGSIPIDEGSVLSELTKYLDDKWEPIINTDVDGPNSLPLRLDRERANLGRYSATRRVARTTYVGSAPRQDNRKGVDIKHILLGSVQPGEPPGVFQDAIRHLSSSATFLYSQGAQYWYDTKPTLTRMATDRAASNFGPDDADIELRKRLHGTVGRGPFGGVHVFPDGPGDVPDEDDAVRLVILPLDASHVAGDGSAAVDAAIGILGQRQGGPRLNRNLLVFLAADANRVEELRQSVYWWKAWESILAERGEEGLNLNPSDVRLAETKLDEADKTITARIGETFQWVLTPRQAPKEAEVTWNAARAAGEGSLAERTARKLESSEHLITRYSGIRVRMDLDRPEATLWEGDRVEVATLWRHYAQRLYMPRLAGRGVLHVAISDGVASTAWSEETFAYAEAYDAEADTFRGLATGSHVDVGPSSTAVLVKPGRALRQLDDVSPQPPVLVGDRSVGIIDVPPDVVPPSERLPTRYHGHKELDPVRAIRDFGSIVNEVVTHLGRDVTLTVTVEATAPDGYDDKTRRTVNENANHLGFDENSFEE